MTKLDNEAKLERSLRRQVKAPRLDGRFDAAIWSRIEAEEQRAANSVRTAAATPAVARWMFIVNALGAAVALALVVYFGMQSLSGVAVDGPAVSASQMSASTLDWIGRVAGWIVTAASLSFGLMFTSIGRRLRAELAQFL